MFLTVGSYLFFFFTFVKITINEYRGFMKKLAMMLLVILTLSSCSQLTNSKKAGVELKNYKSVFVSWILFSEDEWKTHRYGSKQEWVNGIENINKWTQKGAKYWWSHEFPTLPATFAESKDQEPSSENDLLISFPDAKVINDPIRGVFISTSIQFVDVKSGKKLFEIPNDLYFGGGFGFENQLIKAATIIFDKVIYKELNGSLY